MVNSEIVDEALKRAYGLTSVPESYFLSSGMHPQELYRLFDLVRANSVRSVLEIGMARGSSSISLLAALQQTGGTLTSVDPFQRTGYGGEGLKAIDCAGFSDSHVHIEELDYLALPEMVSQNKMFDLVFIDGNHSFDFTLMNFFYADILLRNGGIVAFHDSDWLGVHKVREFVERSKPYECLSPALGSGYPTRSERVIGAVSKLWRMCTSSRFRRELEERKRHWIGLTAYRKLSAHVSDGGKPDHRPL